MIPKDTVDKILDTAQIEDVVEEFVQLKKRGANLLGLCPFHDEKTPSFTVSPTKQIYKCFGCGKAGNVVSFLMEHEHINYPEALTFLAKKYGIEIEEEELSPEQEKEKSQRESLLILLNFAKEFYSDQLFNTEKGRAIGLTYFKERGFSTETIKKFELGYSPEGFDELTKQAIKSSYSKEYLVKSGLAFESKKGDLIDRFRERMMFPIHSVSGRTLGFGGRTLRSDKKEAKYINSPETEVYNKSNILYGIFQAKEGIRKENRCILVEGYTDVISLHQAGITNVVASSGTSLTEDQVKLIKRNTENILFLYDGDEAGLKASLRGTDLALAGGLNVSVVTLPPGEDPDSFARKHKDEEIKEYLNEEATDVIIFKTTLLKKEYGDDPVQKARVTKEVIESVAKVPDTLIRSFYIKECSRLLELPEEVLYRELNKELVDHRKKKEKDHERQARLEERKEQEEPREAEEAVEEQVDEQVRDPQEMEVFKLLIKFGNKEMDEELTVAEHLLHELDEMEIRTPLLKKILLLYHEYIASEDNIPEIEYFVHSEDKEIRDMAAEFLAEKYHISDGWERKVGRNVTPPENFYRKEIHSALYHLKLKKVSNLIRQNEEALKQAESHEKIEELLGIHTYLTELKKNISNSLGSVIIE